jgi:transcriptional regulator with XRE-family HTH domain
MPPPTTARLRSTELLRGYINVSRLTYREIAAQAGIAHATLANLARPGGRTTCSIDVAQRIAAALDVAVAVLFEFIVLSEASITPASAPIFDAEPTGTTGRVQ